VVEIGLPSFLKSRKNQREDPFSFADDRDIRYACFEKKGMLKGHFRTADNHLHAGENLPNPSHKLKGALNVPQIESAADEIGLPVNNLFKQMPVVEFLFFRPQPPSLVVGGGTGALHSVEQIEGGHGQIFPCSRVILQAGQLEEEERLDGLSVLHKAIFYHRSVLSTNDAKDLMPVKGKGSSGFDPGRRKE
jgi:hypothetical protein